MSHPVPSQDVTEPMLPEDDYNHETADGPRPDEKYPCLKETGYFDPVTHALMKPMPKKRVAKNTRTATIMEKGMATLEDAKLAEQRKAIAAKVILKGDLRDLTDGEKLLYYKMRCDEQGLDVFSKPFDYIELKGKHVLYANKNAAEQLRAIHQISIEIVEAKVDAGCYIVIAKATKPDGRSDSAIAAVPIDKLVGDVRANAIMKAETKAKRRVTLSIQGLNMLDETEVETIPDAHRLNVQDEEVIDIKTQ